MTVVGVGGGDIEGCRVYFTISFCRLSVLIHGCGGLTLTTQQPITLGTTEDFIWHRQISLKVSIFAWLPTKTNMLNRDIITHESHFCVFGCG
jgi:hypothetical protein